MNEETRKKFYEYMIFLFKGFDKVLENQLSPFQFSDSSVVYTILINKYLAVRFKFISSYDEKRIVLQVEQIWLRFKGHSPPTSIIHLVVGEMDSLNKKVVFGRIRESLREVSDRLINDYRKKQANLERDIDCLANYEYEEDDN